MMKYMDRKHALAVILSVIVLVVVGKWWRGRIRPINYTLLEEKKGLIAELADTIIPRTHSPGAKDANVAVFIVEMVRRGISLQEARTFMRGLDAIETYCNSHFRKGFVACGVDERIRVLRHFEANDRWPDTGVLRKIRNKLEVRPFFSLLRELTVVGYCTSEVGCTQALVYDYIPEYYLPCVTLEVGQRAWATA